LRSLGTRPYFDGLCGFARSAGPGLGRHPSGLQVGGPARRDCLAMLGARWCRGTHFADFVRFVQTTTASQILMRAARAHLTPALLSTHQAPRRIPPQPFVRPAGGLARSHVGVPTWSCFAPVSAPPSCPTICEAIRDEPVAGRATSGAARRTGRGGLPLASRGVGEDCLSWPSASEFRSRPPWPSTAAQSIAKRWTVPIGALPATGSSPPRALLKSRQDQASLTAGPVTPSIPQLTKAAMSATSVTPSA
jgi:hypothetical protein